MCTRLAAGRGEGMTTGRMLEDLQYYTDSLEVKIDKLETQNKRLRDFEHRRVYASPERWKELISLEAQNKAYDEFRDKVAFVINHMPMGDEAYAMLTTSIAAIGGTK